MNYSQIACKYVFQILHPDRTGSIDTQFDGQHPNSYFEASLNYYSENTKKSSLDNNKNNNNFKDISNIK